MSGVKRTRNFSELGPRKHDDRKKEASQNADYYLGRMAVKEKTPERIQTTGKKRRAQKEEQWEIRRNNLETYECSSGSVDDVDVFDSASSDKQYKRRMAISYMMELAKYPHPDTWEDLKLLPRIEQRLNIPKNSRHATKKILEDIFECHVSENIYDPRGQASLRGCKATIAEEGEEADLILSFLDKGVTPGGVLMFVNYERSRRSESPVGKKAIQGFIDRNPCVNKSRRLTKKSGKTDPTSNWAKARLVQFTQLQEQFTLGKVRDGLIREENVDPSIINSGLQPMYLHKICFFDEKHSKVVKGPTGMYDYSVSRNSYDNEITHPDLGGKFRDPKHRQSMKFPGEGRILFGGCMIKESDGTVKGVKLRPFDYTNRTLVTVADFDRKKNEMFNNVKLSNNEKTPGGRDKKWKGGYEVRYPDNHEEHLLRDMNLKFCSAKEIIDHMLAEVKRIYQDDEEAKVYHDHLSILWDKSGVNYMKEVGLYDMMIKIESVNHDKVSKHYRDTVVGDTPEMARGLDSFCFADLERLMALHVALTNDLPKEDPKKFSLSSPDAVASTMKRCWSIIPDKRMADDISGLEHVLQKGIEYEGCIIPDEDVRRGHRAMKLDGSAPMKSPVRRIQPVTELILHSDAKEIYEKLSPSARSNIDKDVDEAEQHQPFANILALGNDEEEKNEGLYICLHL